MPKRMCSTPSRRYVAATRSCLDLGIDLGSPVGLEYYEQAPFKFNGQIEQVRVNHRK